MPVIYDYLDYRKFLEDFYKEKKENNPDYSYRMFCRKSGIKDPSFYIKVVNGEKALSKNAVKKMVKGMELDEDEASYFELLVHYSQAENKHNKKFFYRKLLNLKMEHHPEEHYTIKRRYYSKWYNPIVREIVAVEGFDGNYSKLAKKVQPPITEEQAKESVDLLRELGFIDNKDKIAGEKLKLKPRSVLKKTIREVQKEWISQSAGAVDEVSPEDREVSSLFLPLNKEEFEKVKEYIRELRSMTGNISYENKEKNSQIYQLNIQLFPRSEVLE